MTVYDNMAFGLKLRKYSKKTSTNVYEAAGNSWFEELLDRKPAVLSGGQHQRVAMGRAIVRVLRYCLMDEPLSTWMQNCVYLCVLKSLKSPSYRSYNYRNSRPKQKR